MQLGCAQVTLQPVAGWYQAREAEVRHHEGDLGERGGWYCVYPPRPALFTRVGFLLQALCYSTEVPSWGATLHTLPVFSKGIVLFSNPRRRWYLGPYGWQPTAGRNDSTARGVVDWTAGLDHSVNREARDLERHHGAD